MSKPLPSFVNTHKLLCFGVVGVLLAGMVLTLWLSTATPLLVCSLLAVLLSLVMLGMHSRSFREQQQIALENKRKKVLELRQSLTTQQQEFTEAIQKAELQLAEQSRTLTEQLARLRESEEYLEPSNYFPSSSADASANRSAEKDQQLLAVIKQAHQQLFEAIQSNKYSVGGNFEARLLREDLLELASSVARIYRPDSANPLMEASPEQLLRANNRISFQLLLLFDQLPIDLKSYSLNGLYQTVKQSVTAYGIYQKASPWLNWGTKGLYVGRMVSASNPVSMGLWWGATELAKVGATQLAKKYMQQQAMALLQTVVEVVGYEVAAIYDSGFPQRDPNWVFGLELSQLLKSFPTSRESLQAGLSELTRLPLRSEYDRIRLIRAVVNQKSLIGQFPHDLELTVEQRQQIVDQLEKFLERSVHGVTPQQLTTWSTEVSSRYGIQMRTEFEHRQENTSDVQSSVESLFLFLETVKGMEAEASRKLLSELITQPEWQQALQATQQWETASPIPGLDPESPVCREYLDLLVKAHSQSLQWFEEHELLVTEHFAFFRLSAESAIKSLTAAYTQSLHQRFQLESNKSLCLAELRHIHESLDENETILGLWATKITHHPVDCPSETGWLIVTSKQALLTTEDSGTWFSFQQLRWQNKAGLFAGSLLLTDLQSQWVLQIEGALTLKFNDYFKVLIERVSCHESQ